MKCVCVWGGAIKAKRLFICFGNHFVHMYSCVAQTVLVRRRRTGCHTGVDCRGVQYCRPRKFKHQTTLYTPRPNVCFASLTEAETDRR